MKRPYLSLAAMLVVVGLALSACLHGIQITDSTGQVLGYLTPGVPVVVTERKAGTQRILLKGWVAEANDVGLREVENYEGLFYGSLDVGQKGTATRILGTLENRTGECFKLLTLEASFWEGSADGGTVKGTASTSLRRLQKGERVPLNILAPGFSQDKIKTSIIRVRFSDSLPCSRSKP